MLLLITVSKHLTISAGMGMNMKIYNQFWSIAAFNRHPLIELINSVLVYACKTYTHARLHFNFIQISLTNMAFPQKSWQVRQWRQSQNLPV